jgi:hypothetical protein
LSKQKPEFIRNNILVFLDVKDLGKLSLCSKQFWSMLNPPYTQKMVFLMNYEWLVETKVGLTGEQA